ncbi:MAG TPA: aspartyl protease family protein [Allosphingosinicella sp.]|nr:aspartyl protease family protein [Allosphingosinicella sp.]
MRIASTLLLVVAALGGVAVQTQVQAQRPAIAFAAGAEAVPFELFRGNRIFLQGTINGHPASMLLDSGASGTVLSETFAARIGAGQGHATVSRGIGGEVAARRVSNISLRVGPLSIGRASPVVLDLGQIERGVGRPIDAILGMDAFRAGIVDVDFPARTIRFAPASGFSPPAGAIAVPIRQEHGRRTIPIAIGDGPLIQADLDLGHGGSLLLSREVWQRDAAIAALPSVSTSAGGVGGRVPKRLVTLPSVSLGGHSFRAVPTLLNEGANDLPVSGGNVGIDLLQRFRLIFDYGRSRLYLVPDPAAMAEPLPKNRMGLRLELAGDRLRVAEVMPGSPAAEAGWRAGDEIASVNGRPVDARFWFRDDARFSMLPAGTRVELVRADGTALPLTLRDFY